MPVTRSLENGNVLQDWTQDVINMPVLSGMLNGMGLFNETATSQTSVLFERDNRSYTMLPQTSRKQRNASTGSDRDTKVFSLPMPYTKHIDYLTTDDVQGQRMFGTPDGAETVANAAMIKVEDMRIRADQTKEYMKLEAIKGVSLDAEGNTLANMFTEFGVSQSSIDFVLGTSTTNVPAKIHELMRTVGVNNRSGVPATTPIVLCGNDYFTKLATHAKVEAAFANYKQEDGVQRLRDNLFVFDAWGATGTFKWMGVTFVNYAPTFTRPDGTTATPIASNDGYVILPTARDLYRGINGPSNKMSGANQPGAPMFMYQWPDSKDEGIEFELEMSNLYFMTNPLMSIKVTTSN